MIDDGSTDGTAEIVRRNFQGVRLFVQRVNGGKAAALNRGLEHAVHSLVVTVDADSRLQADALRFLVREYLNGQPHTAAVAGAVFVNNGPTNWVSRVQYWDYFHGIAATKRAQAAYGGTLVAQGAFSLYRTDILREIGGRPACVGEDIVVTWHGEGVWNVRFTESTGYEAGLRMRRAFGDWRVIASADLGRERIDREIEKPTAAVALLAQRTFSNGVTAGVQFSYYRAAGANTTLNPEEAYAWRMGRVYAAIPF